VYNACDALVTGTIAKAVVFLGDFAPIWYFVGGLSLAVGLLVFTRDFVRGR